MIFAEIWQCLFIANIICEVISKEQALNLLPPVNMYSWSNTGTQEGCTVTICPKGVKRCLQQKMREKSAHQRNLPTLKEWPLSLNLQMPKMNQKPVMMNRRHLEIILDKPNIAAYTPSEQAVIPVVSNFENYVPNSEEMQTEENFSLKEILHSNYLKYINASYYDTNNVIMYLNGNKENEARNSAPSYIPPMEINNAPSNIFPMEINNAPSNILPMEINNAPSYIPPMEINNAPSNILPMGINNAPSNIPPMEINNAPSYIPPMEINNQFNTFTPNINNYENYSPLTDESVTGSSNPMLDNTANRQPAVEIPNSNSNPRANSIQQKKIPQYIFVDGQYVREDVVTNLEKPQERANEVRQETNIPPMEINNQFNTFTPNVNNYENYSPLTDVSVTGSSNPMLDNNANRQPADEIPNSNSNPRANSIQQKKIPQYTSVDGQNTPAEVNPQNRFSSNTSNTENQTPTIPPNVEKQMDNFNNQEHNNNMDQPIFVFCNHPIFTVFMENAFPHYHVNLSPPNNQHYQETAFRVWVPQW